MSELRQGFSDSMVVNLEVCCGRPASRITWWKKKGSGHKDVAHSKALAIFTTLDLEDQPDLVVQATVQSCSSV